MAMNDPNNYLKYCDVGGSIVREILPEIRDKLSMSDNEYVLDVGCGPGINTSRNLAPYMPDGANIMATDLSSKMIDFAKEHYSTPLLTFKTLDITDSNLWSTWRKEEFSKIFSFYTMHRIINQRIAFENMYNFLKPGGELIAITPTENCLEQILPYLAKMPKYSAYAEAISKMTVHLNPTKNYNADAEDLLKSVGFEVKVCKYTSKTFCAPSIDYLVEYYGIISYLSSILPSDLFAEALLDAKKIILENNLFEEKNSGLILRYVVSVIVAKKPIK